MSAGYLENYQNHQEKSNWTAYHVSSLFYEIGIGQIKPMIIPKN